MTSTRPRALIAHGWLGRAGQLRPLARNLKAAGFDVELLGYPTAFGSFEGALEIARLAARRVADRPLHLIGYSFGGLVMRALAAENPPGLISLLLVGTPNEGSRLADLICRVTPTPVLRRLATDAPELPRIDDVRIGCIAGSRKGLIGIFLDGENDGRVAVSSALSLPNSEGRVVRVGHRALPSHSETARLAISFLRTGHF